MSGKDCPFCTLPAGRILIETEHCLVLRDAYPLSEGHTLVIPRAHVRSLYELPPQVQVELWQEVAKVRQILQEELCPDAFNIGVNDGQAAGQTVGHTHIHVIPRRHGDVEDPRGGIRWVLPKKAKYW